MFGKQKIYNICKKRPATNIIKETVNGQSVEFCFCNECASKVNLDNNYNIFLSNIFNDFTDNFYNEDSLFEKPRPKKVCKCGCTEEDIINSGRFGCSECYKTFSDLVDQYVQRLGGKTYSGTMPNHVETENQKPLSKEEQMKKLQTQLNEAIAKKDYKKADEISNQIIDLNKGKIGG